MSKASFRSRNSNSLILVVLILRRWFYATPLAVTLGCPIVSQISLVCLTVKGINTEELIDTKVLQLTVTPHKDEDFEAFTVRPYIWETLNVCSDIIDVKSMLSTYPRLAVLDLVSYSCGKIEMILREDVYHAIHPLQYFAADEKCSSFAARLRIG